MDEGVLPMLADVFLRASHGDLEARVPSLGDSDEAIVARAAMNHLLDMSDMFVREAGGASAAASEGRFHRRVLAAGPRGSYGRAAEQISASIDAMSRSAARLAEATAARLALADELENAVLRVSEQVATAATEMGASANGLADFARSAVSEA